jgi:amino acid adenylation domain-containing protein
MSNETQYEGIAIVGMSGRFPGAENIAEFWSNLLNSKETVSFYSDAELAEAGLNIQELRRRGKYVAARGFLKDADCFDAAFFGIHPKEAEVLDPQHRVFLEACWSALESAGYAPNRMDSVVGVFGGVTYNTYYMQVLHRRQDLIDLVGSDLVMFGNEKDYVTTRVAYKLGLKGPAVNVSTACSTSLVAVAQACQSLLTYQCDLALAGGASVNVPQKRGYYHDEGNIGSADGHTRTFDALATGTAFGNGVGVVVLKRLEEAVSDGDQIYAVIKGAALNNDGSQRVSFGAPGVDGQSRVIAMAHALAGVDPETITYVEAHGTATPLGDPIEVAGLTKAFREATNAKQFCAIGSVKSNLGHLDAAAGVTGLIKTCLSLKHKILPASLHFTKPNPKLDIENTPFYVNATRQVWAAKQGIPRRAGVSSFGSGGTNAHVVVEEAPELPVSGPSRPWQLLPLSAKSSEALDRATSNLSDHFKRTCDEVSAERANAELADAAFTLQTGRAELNFRRIIVAQDVSEAGSALDARDAKRVFSQQQKLSNPTVVFMFPGQGAQYAGMGAELYRTEAVFRQEVDRCAAVLQPLLKRDLLSVVFATNGTASEAEKLLVQTSFTQPALFVIEYALAKLWMSWGIKPVAMIGHSVGEYVAGCLAGVFTLEDALTLVARRGALVQEQPGGAMLIVRQSEQEVLPLLNQKMSIAAINSPNLCVVAGPYEEIASLERKLESQRVVTKHLNTSHAFHSPMMEPVLEPFTRLLQQVTLGAPQIPYVSNVTARWITADEARKPDYWAGHVRQTVRFADGIAQLMKDPTHVLLEVGPGQTLGTLARQHPAKSGEQIVLSSLPLTGALELRGFFETLGRLWMSGVSVDWQQFYAGERRHRVALPTYPFERKRYWPESLANTQSVRIPETEDSSQSQSELTPSHSADSQVPTSPMPLPVSQVTETSRKDRLIGASRGLLAELSGYDLSDVEPTADLMELGLDSLLLTQASQLLQRKFGVSVTFRQLMEELSSIDAIAAYLDTAMPPEAFAPPVAPSTPVAANLALQNNSVPVTPIAAVGSNAALLQILQQQQLLTNQILQWMTGQQPAIQSATANSPTAVAPAAVATQKPVPVVPAKPEGKSHGPFKPFDRNASLAATPEQTQALHALIERYSKRTAQSKKLAAKNRPFVADPRSASGFNRLWKEMVYPIYTTRSNGCKVWDVDGNEYIDFVMGFGASMFGHRPEFVVKAVRDQLDAGFEIGPIQPIVGEVSEMVREMTGMPRVAFTNTGSEAVLAATRVARTVTGRDKIAVFAGAYHGIFDEVLFRPLTVNGETRTAAIAPGIPQTAIDQVIVLDYGNPQSLEILKARGSEIAAVLVEPVQSRRLDLQPKEFMHELRRVTQETGSALVFDEVVTGFRVHPGGAQAYFGVRADLATYGKVIGGGMSLGVVTGIPKFMDALDGGQWQYGDTSFPEVGVTFFAGTFVRHPLVMAAAKSVLTHLKQSGPELQVRLSARTEKLANELRAIVSEFNAPFVVSQFSSLMHISYPSDQKFASLLFYLLRERGIHIYDNRAFVMTTAHSEADLSAFLKVFRECLKEMSANVFFSPPTGPPPQATKHPSIPATSSVPTLGDGAATSQTPAPLTTRASVASLSEPFPLTEPQKEIWLASQMGGQAVLAYNESLKLEFRGPFDVATFRAAAALVLERHPILLASISSDGQTQRVRPETKLDFPFFDFCNQADAGKKLQEIIDGEISAEFNLTTGPLLRVRIVRLASHHHVVVWTAHHIICDGWSGGLIVSELSRIYSALQQGTEPDLEPPLSFREYALAAENDSKQRDQANAYWTKRFATLPAPLDLPADHLRSAIRSARASTVKRDLGPDIHKTLKRFAGQQRTTLVVLLMAGWKVLLHRLSSQTDLVVGLGVAGQAITGQTCLVGHCVNLLPIRNELNSEESFQSMLAKEKKAVLDAYDHSQTTVGDILQHVSVPRIPGRPPLVEVIFNVDRDPGDVQFHGLDFSCERNAKRALHYDLFLNVVEGPRGLYAECDFNSDLFDPATIERWLGHYHTLLQGVIANSLNSLDTLALLSDSEQKQVTLDFNQNAVDYRFPGLLHELIERQVEKSPQLPAVTFENKTLTYAELNQRANQLANHLRKLGVGPDVLVGVFMERSIEMVVGLVAILKAGAAYVPIDPEYPQDRVAFMIRDADCPVLLIHAGVKEKLPRCECKVIDLADDWNLIARESSDNLPPVASSENLAYMIYTSGSTGMPKGAMNSHRGICNRLLWMQSEYRMAESDVVLQKTPFSFDVSVWEFFWPLIVGARLVVAKPGGHRDAGYLVDTFQQHAVTITHFVPSMLAAFLAEPRAKQCRSLRHVICSGEALSLNLQNEFFKLLPAKLHNLYGPTEAAVDVTYWNCRPDTGLNIVPIGKPVANTQIYILDEKRQPVPIGVPGELFIAGVQVGRGYRNRPELTAEKFVPAPFSANPEGKAYRTGDSCRWLPDGNVEYLGRLDFQVKLHGLRIELGEIETVLGRHPCVQQSVVVAREIDPGNKALVAYIEPRPGAKLEISELRNHLKRDLPEYMVPSAFVLLENLPLSPNGKIDRKALPNPEANRLQSKKEFVAPGDRIEQSLAEIWSRILKVDGIGVQDNFFELGGHSLLAVRIVVEIEKIYKHRLPLATFLQAPTVAALAEILRQHTAARAWSSLVPIRTGGSKSPLFLIHSHGGNVLEYYPLAHLLPKDQPVVALQARGLDGNIPKNLTIEEAASAYLAEIRELQASGPYFLGGFCFGGLVAYEAAQQLRAAGEEVALLALLQTVHPQAMHFKPEATALHRFWYRASKRISLERENLGHRGTRHIGDRFRRALDVTKARTAIRLRSAFGNGQSVRPGASMAEVLEILGIEHDRAFEKYVPKPFYGNAVLFRAAKQMPGILADSSLGWKPLMTGKFMVCEIPGHQQNMLVEPNVSHLAHELQQRISDFQLARKDRVA